MDVDQLQKMLDILLRMERLMRPPLRKTVSFDATPEVQLIKARASERGNLISTASGADFVLSEVREFDRIINFWATWCPPCVHELPQLNTIATELSADGIKVILVSMDRGGAAMAGPFLSERNITAPLSLYDPSASWARALALKGLPTTLLIKKNSESYQVHTGPADWDDDKIKGQIKSYLAS